MEDLKLVEKVVITPENPTDRRRIFLSNIDLSLVVYQESVSFFDPPLSKLSFSESCNNLCSALGKLLVPYDFFAGRLVPALEDKDRFEIDCNGAGAVVAAAKTSSTLSQLGELLAPKEEFRQLVAFLQDESEQVELQDKPLLHLQLTHFGCGSLALASRYNHCVLDGIAVREFEKNLAALTRGDEIVMLPNPDRTIFKARNPPRINHPHYEYSTGCRTDSLFTVCGTSGINVNNCLPQNKTRLIFISPKRIASLKKAALQDGKLKRCSSFQVVAAKIWKARSIAMKMQDDVNSMMLFPVDARKIVAPQAPNGFAGNALVPGFSRASVKELKDGEDSVLVKKVQEGIERLDDEYVRSGIDWLEVHRGVPCRENSFSLVAWFRLGLEEDVFSWGKIKCATPILIKPGLVILLPGPEGEGGLNVCLELPDDQMDEFCRLLMG
ncbi:hydroxycinnamoyltransferase-like [Ricinus communis]|uniref:hydroxycinnamoyltransferase-like n=1 Tax=Ricinus communis TaxID=3988 RepID=UPI00201A8F23|nr:hydroxycinnamoyltransferase-like [Ricinus communis]